MKNFKSKAVAFGTAIYTGIGSAIAAVPADVTTEMTSMKADALTVGGAFLVAVIAIGALKLMRRAL